MRPCKSCGQDWVPDPLEAEFFRKNGTAVPRVCTSCRAAKRKLTDGTLSCQKCGIDFAWPKEMALYASMFEWKEPHRCPGGCVGDRSEIKRMRGDMYAIGPVWLRVVEGVDIDAEPAEELTPEQQLRATPVPKLDDLFKGLGSGMSSPSFENLSGRSSVEPEPASGGDDLPPENLPSPDSLFSKLGGK